MIMKEIVEEAFDRVVDVLSKIELPKEVEGYKSKTINIANWINIGLSRINIRVTKNTTYKALVWQHFDFLRVASVLFVISLLNERRFLDELEYVYDLMSDKYSQKTLLSFVTYRIYHAFLPYTYFLEYFQPAIKQEEINRFCGNNLLSDNFRCYNYKGLKIVGIDCKTVYQSVFRETYRYFDVIVPQRGMNVLDIGAFRGETAIWFYSYVGNEGRIYAIEGERSNVVRIERNIKLNRVPNIYIIPYYIGSSVDIKQKVVSLDYLYEQRILDVKTHFWKFDIEGYEQMALKGALSALRKNYPVLAVSVYHRSDDIVVIPKFLKEIGYTEFFLKHSGYNMGDWILFARRR